MPQTIPDVVLARIDLHRAEAGHRAAKLDADLRARVLGTAMSAQLRKARDQARAEAEAWAILLTYRPDTAKVCPKCSRTMEDCTCKGGVTLQWGKTQLDMCANSICGHLHREHDAEGCTVTVPCDDPEFGPTMTCPCGNKGPKQ